MHRRKLVALTLGLVVLGLIATGYLLYSDAQSQQVPEDDDDVCDIEDPDNRT